MADVAKPTQEQLRRQSRTKALELAVETVKSTRAFTNFQVIHTAASYEAYIWDGTTPPLPTVPAQAAELAPPERFEPREGDDGEV